MRVLFFGDIFGKPGRRAIKATLPDLKSKYSPQFVIGNVENLAGGRGVNRKTLQELLDLGFHGFSSGNHIWDNKDIFSILENESRLIRPANYPDAGGHYCPGRGHTVLEAAGEKLLLINLMGRVFMDSIDCPFQAVDRILKQQLERLPILVDMHADATSEMYAMGWFLNGRVSAVVGSHTHVQTADERILPAGTAYITDVGLTGSFDSVIGLEPDEVVKKFLTKRPQRYSNAERNPGISCVVIDIGADNKATKIERIRYSLPELDLTSEKDDE